MIYYKDGAKRMRPVLSRPEYLALRNSGEQIANVAAAREGDGTAKRRLLQMNYSCLPNEDGTLRGAKVASGAVGMDIDWTPSPLPPVGEEQIAARKEEWLKKVPELVLAKKEELGLLMLERSASKGYHLVFRRRPELTQEENLRWASEVLGVAYDAGAKDITRVFFTTTASAEDLLFLDDGIFDPSPRSPEGEGGHHQDVASSQAKAVENTTSHAQDVESTAAHAQASKSTAALTHSAPSLIGRAGGESGSSFLLSFKGIPYSSIIAEWWRRTGGEPAEGERNDKLHKLAANLRAICDNSEAWLLEIMPRYGLSEQEMRSIVHSACKEPTKGSKMMTSIVDALAPLSSSGGDTDPMSFDDVELQDNRSPLGGLKGGSLRSLPLGLKESLAGVPAAMHMPVLCGVLPIAAAYADGVEVEYCDGQRQHLGLMSIIRGEQASGKSVVKNAVDVWKRQLDEEDALARRREEEWKERKKSRKANEKAPDDPHVLIRMVPVTVSCSTLLKRFKNAAGHTLYSFGEELDTLRKTNGAGSWSSKYDIYRLSFDRGEWGQDYNSDAAESGVVKVAYNWTMLGTDGALHKCFKQDNIENGLSSRILVAEMPDSSFSKMPKFGRRSPEDEARIQEAVTRLRSYSGFIDTPRLRKAIERWVEEKRVEAAKDIDHVKDVYRKRAAVIGFRCGVIHHLLCGGPSLTPPVGGRTSSPAETIKGKQEEKRLSPQRGERGEGLSTIKFALMMAEYALQQQIAAFGEALQSQYVDASSECQRYGTNHSVFDQLPPTFTLDDLRALKRGFCGESALRKIISRWCRDKWIEKTDKTHWRKVEINNS